MGEDKAKASSPTHSPRAWPLPLPAEEGCCVCRCFSLSRPGTQLPLAAGVIQACPWALGPSSASCAVGIVGADCTGEDDLLGQRWHLKQLKQPGPAQSGGLD